MIKHNKLEICTTNRLTDRLHLAVILVLGITAIMMSYYFVAGFVDTCDGGRMAVLEEENTRLHDFKELIYSLQNFSAHHDGQMTFTGYFTIVTLLWEISPANMLVFGLGKDVPFYLKANVNGRCVFVEESYEWIQMISKPGMEVYHYNYRTVLSQQESLLLNSTYYDENLRMDLPESVLNTFWDIIFVDAPQGWNPETPGRMQSIYMASKFAKQGPPRTVHVFVHDVNRPAEDTWSKALLGEENLVQLMDYKLKYYQIRVL